MRARLLASILAATITACESASIPPDPDPGPPDAAIGTYDMQSAQTRTANCGGSTGTIVNGVIELKADQSWLKIDINTTPGGSSVCGFSGGTWTRIDATTLQLTWSQGPSTPAQATVVGDDLTFGSTGAAYKRRQP